MSVRPYVDAFLRPPYSLASRVSRGRSAENNADAPPRASCEF